ncbi:uncharacterized protein RJT21DRAFT_111455 [Scheffersomyces amazonensis]|uniref:uncharacterized protein n=1 Tax=Scheffersomyces amazonensis TaxID=1078765 RepID=UPI00315CD7C6
MSSKRTHLNRQSRRGQKENKSITIDGELSQPNTHEQQHEIEEIDHLVNQDGSERQESSSKSKYGTLPKKYFCKICNQGFTRKHNMVSHELIHSSIKPHVCTVCDLKFRRIHDLKRHEKLHTGEKPFICSHCNRKFARPDALTRHLNSPNACNVLRERLSSTVQNPIIPEPSSSKVLSISTLQNYQIGNNSTSMPIRIPPPPQLYQINPQIKTLPTTISPSNNISPEFDAKRNNPPHIISSQILSNNQHEAESLNRSGKKSIIPRPLPELPHINHRYYVVNQNSSQQHNQQQLPSIQHFVQSAYHHSPTSTSASPPQGSISHASPTHTPGYGSYSSLGDDSTTNNFHVHPNQFIPSLVPRIYMPGEIVQYRGGSLTGNSADESLESGQSGESQSNQKKKRKE